MSRIRCRKRSKSKLRCRIMNHINWIVGEVEKVWDGAYRLGKSKGTEGASDSCKQVWSSDGKQLEELKGKKKIGEV